MAFTKLYPNYFLSFAHSLHIYSVISILCCFVHHMPYDCYNQLYNFFHFQYFVLSSFSLWCTWLYFPNSFLLCEIFWHLYGQGFGPSMISKAGRSPSSVDTNESWRIWCEVQSTLNGEIYYNMQILEASSNDQCGGSRRNYYYYISQ